MDSEMRLDNTTFLMETFMTAVGKWIKGTDTGHFEKGEPVGEWVTYDDKGKKYKTTNRGKK